MACADDGLTRHSGAGSHFQVLWLGDEDPGPVQVIELIGSPVGLRRFRYSRDGQEQRVELPADPAALYDAAGRYRPVWQQRNGACWHYTWAAAVLSGGHATTPQGWHSISAGPGYLPSTIAGLRKLLQKQHPDKNGGIEGPQFRPAKIKLDLLKKRRRR